MQKDDEADREDTQAEISEINIYITDKVHYLISFILLVKFRRKNQDQNVVQR